MGFASRPVLGGFQLRGVPSRPVFCERLKFGRFQACEQNLPLHVPRGGQNSATAKFRHAVRVVRRYVRNVLFRMARNFEKTCVALDCRKLTIKDMHVETVIPSVVKTVSSMFADNVVLKFV